MGLRWAGLRRLGRQRTAIVAILEAAAQWDLAPVFVTTGIPNVTGLLAKPFKASRVQHTLLPALAGFAVGFSWLADGAILWLAARRAVVTDDSTANDKCTRLARLWLCRADIVHAAISLGGPDNGTMIILAGSRTQQCKASDAPGKMDRY